MNQNKTLIQLCIQGFKLLHMRTALAIVANHSNCNTKPLLQFKPQQYQSFKTAIAAATLHQGFKLHSGCNFATSNTATIEVMLRLLKLHASTFVLQHCFTAGRPSVVPLVVLRLSFAPLLSQVLFVLQLCWLHLGSVYLETLI